MTTKDRNLSLDRDLLRPKAAHSQTVQPGNTRQVATPNNTRPPGNRVTGRTAPQNTRSWQGITAIGIAITNMLFLVLAGIWLSERAGGLSTQAALPRSDITPQLEVMQTRLEQRIGTLEQQLADLQIAINGQQHLIISAYQEIGVLIKEGNDGTAAPADAAQPSVASSQEAPKTKQVEEKTGWYINLGSFPDKQAASDIQAQFQALGYAARIQALETDNQTAYAVLLPGFKDQASAEMTVNQLLDQIELDGLSVWKEK